MRLAVLLPPTGADERDRLATRDLQAVVLVDLGVGTSGVRELHVAKLNVAGHMVERTTSARSCIDQRLALDVFDHTSGRSYGLESICRSLRSHSSGKRTEHGRHQDHEKLLKRDDFTQIQRQLM